MSENEFRIFLGFKKCFSRNIKMYILQNIFLHIFVVLEVVVFFLILQFASPQVARDANCKITKKDKNTKNNIFGSKKKT